jgi:hypothetical protein
MLHQNALLAAWNKEFKEQLAIITKRKTHKRKQIQHSSTIEYSESVSYVAAEASVAARQSKKARGSGDQERAPPALQRCGNCSRTGHNTRTCKNIQRYLLN